MRKPKAFFYVCAGLFLLAFYHLGARSAVAQAPGNPVVGTISLGCGNHNAGIVTANGDVFASEDCWITWTRQGNVFGGGPVPAQRETFGAMKSRYRGAPGAAQPTAQDK